MCLTGEPQPEELYLMLGYTVSVPPYVRQALFSRSIDNDDLMPQLRATPVLIVHGDSDAVVKPEVVAQHAAALPHAQIAMLAGAGHSPCWEHAASFNEQVRLFCQRLEVQAV